MNDRRKAILQDFSILTGGQVIADDGDERTVQPGLSFALELSKVAAGGCIGGCGLSFSQSLAPPSLPPPAPRVLSEITIAFSGDFDTIA